MIQFLADKTASYLAKGDDPADVEVIAYGYYIFYQQWLMTLAILLVALPFGWFFSILASLVTSLAMRGCVCGTHATHPLVCKIASFAVAFTPVILAEVFALRIVPVAAIIMYVLGAVMILKYAPGDTDVKKIHNPDIRKSMKIQAMVRLSVFFVVAMLINGRFPEIAFVIATTAFIACCFVHPWAYRLFGFDPVTKEALRSRH